MLSTLRDAFGWDEEMALSPGPRGALGQIWRLDVGRKRFALKEIFAEPPSEASIEAELAFVRRAITAGVRAPASHAGSDGRYLFTTPDGTWLRLYDWVDVRPVDLAAKATPELVGVLLARLHRAATATDQPLDRWYDRVPDPHEWQGVSLPDAVRATLPELGPTVVAADPADFVVCHRDLHPENVLAGGDGGLVVLDWDNFGPAAPSRELACGLFDWCCDGRADLDAMGRMYDVYLHEGGPGRITEPADFSMLIAIRLNFLLLQARIAVDPLSATRDREWARREVEQMLPLLPTPGQLAVVLELTRARSA